MSKEIVVHNRAEINRIASEEDALRSAGLLQTAEYLIDKLNDFDNSAKKCMNFRGIMCNALVFHYLHGINLNPYDHDIDRCGCGYIIPYIKSMRDDAKIELNVPSELIERFTEKPERLSITSTSYGDCLFELLKALPDVLLDAPVEYPDMPEFYFDIPGLEMYKFFMNIRIESLDDIALIQQLSHGSFGITNGMYQAYCNGALTKNDLKLALFPERIYGLLVTNGIESEKAFTYTQNYRFGFSDNEECDTSLKPLEKYKGYVQGKHYLFPGGHCYSYANIINRLVAIKVQYPEIFSKVSEQFLYHAEEDSNTSD